VTASTYDVTISGGDLASFNGTVNLNLDAAQNITDLASNALPTTEPAPAADQTYTVDNAAPTVAATNLLAAYAGTGPSSFVITFNEDVYNPVGDTDPDDVTNPGNYVLLEQGSVIGFQTTACNAIDAVNDIRGTPNSVIYIPNTAVVDLGGGLPVGTYRLFICGTTSIVDLTLNPLMGNGVAAGTDFIFDFIVAPAEPAATEAATGGKVTASALPATGFAPNKFTTLPAQPATLKYAELSDLWLEIPSLNVTSTIVGVPQNKDNTWDVTWLGNDTGWLNGTAFPTWNGNSVLTAHVTNADGLDGPFAALKKLKYGDQVIIHMGGAKYIYEIRATKLARPYSTSFAFQSMQDHSYLTLITCQGYNPLNESYLFRRVIRAVLVEVK
jgi:LPXTG-site transpeptidase (sortase) family protein